MQLVLFCIRISTGIAKLRILEHIPKGFFVNYRWKRNRMRPSVAETRPFICAALELLIVMILGAASAQAARLAVRTYTTADGLPRDTAYCIVQDSRGFLWFCTADGLSRFDGYGFTNYTTDDGLPNRVVNAFFVGGYVAERTCPGLDALLPPGKKLRRCPA